jgi:hypothetical protein
LDCSGGSCNYLTKKRSCVSLVRIKYVKKIPAFRAEWVGLVLYAVFRKGLLNDVI